MTSTSVFLMAQRSLDLGVCSSAVHRPWHLDAGGKVGLGSLFYSRAAFKVGTSPYYMSALNRNIPGFGYFASIEVLHKEIFLAQNNLFVT